MKPERLRVLLVGGLVVAAAGACGGRDEEGVTAAALHAAAHNLELVPVPDAPVGASEANEDSAPTLPKVTEAAGDARDGQIAVIGEHGHLASVTDPSVADVWLKWRARPSLDGATAVMTIQEEAARTLDETHVAWVSLPDAVETDQLVVAGAGEVNAVSYDGDLVAFTNFAEPQRVGEIAGAKSSTTLRIADRDGIRYEASLDGNFVAEAFGRTTGADGLPDQIFLLEHIPADAPRFYRVRVLSTETGEVSLPLNIRDKTQLVDERMSGLSRSQVIADEHGLLFTLYRGTVDGTPDGEPYAFVHTLDLANGVWCLFLDPKLELETVPGAIAVGGDRLFVASSNGHVGSIPIPSITDAERSTEMDWIVQVGEPSARPPALLADAAGVWIGSHDGSQRVLRVDNDGRLTAQQQIHGWYPTALAFDDTGQIIAAGDGWSTLGDLAVPDWFGAPAAVFAG